MSEINKLFLNVGDLVEDNISGKTGIILEIKKWSYSVTDGGTDVYIHWSDGDIFWTHSSELSVISQTEGEYNKVIKSSYDMVTSVVPKNKSD